jgi:hypothetical protein
MVTHEGLSLAAGVVGVALVAATTIPAFKQLAAAISHPKRLYETLYEDDDGVATEESMSAYSDRVPRSILCFSSIVGFLASVASSVLASLYPEKSPLVEPWINVLCWVSLDFLTFLCSVAPDCWLLGWVAPTRLQLRSVFLP